MGEAQGAPKDRIDETPDKVSPSFEDLVTIGVDYDYNSDLEQNPGWELTNLGKASFDCNDVAETDNEVITPENQSLDPKSDNIGKKATVIEASNNIDLHPINSESDQGLLSADEIKSQESPIQSSPTQPKIHDQDEEHGDRATLEGSPQQEPKTQLNVSQEVEINNSQDDEPPAAEANELPLTKAYEPPETEADKPSTEVIEEPLAEETEQTHPEDHTEPLAGVDANSILTAPAGKSSDPEQVEEVISTAPTGTIPKSPSISSINVPMEEVMNDHVESDSCAKPQDMIDSQSVTIDEHRTATTTETEKDIVDEPEPRTAPLLEHNPVEVDTKAELKDTSAEVTPTRSTKRQKISRELELLKDERAEEFQVTDDSDLRTRSSRRVKAIKQEAKTSAEKNSELNNQPHCPLPETSNIADDKEVGEVEPSKTLHQTPQNQKSKSSKRQADTQPKIHLKRPKRQSDEHEEVKEKPAVKASHRAPSRSTIASSMPSSIRDHPRQATDADIGLDKKYRCEKCQYATDRLNNIVFHKKSTCVYTQKQYADQVAQWKLKMQSPKSNRKSR